MSNKRHKYFNKVPPFKPDPEHYTRKQHSWKAKEAYETEDDAWEYLNQNPKLKAEGMTVYRCRTCNKWHVGHRKQRMSMFMNHRLRRKTQKIYA